MRDFAFAMFLFAVFLKAFPLDTDVTQCRIIGSPESSLLSKDGDIVIGGAFSIHSQMSKRDLSFRETPEHLRCSRYWSLPTLTVFVDV